MASKLKDDSDRTRPSINPKHQDTFPLQMSDLTFIEEIGRGGYGTVFKVAFNKPYLDVTEAAAKRVDGYNLKEEANLMRDLDHPNIVKLYGVLDGQMGTKILLLEYAPNGTVRDYLNELQGSRIPATLFKKWARESFALALLYLHSKRIIHRDLKASNALLFEQYALKLSDFGLAREMGDSETTSTAKGTWRYMAPEIHTDDHFSFQTDIYAYGMLVLEIGTGKIPFSDLELTVHVVYRVAMDHIKPNIPLDFPEDLADFIHRCWSPTPKYRPSLEEGLQVIDSMDDNPVLTQHQGAAASSSLGSHVKQWRLVREFGKKKDEPTSSSSLGSLVRKWRLVRKFFKKDEAEGEFIRAVGIAVCNNSDVVVTDFPNWEDDKRPPRRACVFTNHGTFKRTLHPPADKPEARMASPHDVAITSTGQIAIADSESKYVKLFNKGELYLRMFPVLPDEDQTTQVQPYSITVAPNDDLLVGCVNRKVVTVHDASDGRLKTTIPLSIDPANMTNNSKQHIIVSDWETKKIIAVNYEGQVIFALESFSVDGEPGSPEGLTCDDQNSLFVAVQRFDPADNQGYADTGHIHQYSPWGRFMRCIIKDMYSPFGITWCRDSIYVANETHVSVYTHN